MSGLRSYLTVLFLFILLCNLMGLIPGLESPTAKLWCRWASRW